MGAEHIRNLAITPGAELVAIVDPVDSSARGATEAAAKPDLRRFAQFAVPEQHQLVIGEGAAEKQLALGVELRRIEAAQLDTESRPERPLRDVLKR